MTASLGVHCETEGQQHRTPPPPSPQLPGLFSPECQPDLPGGENESDTHPGGENEFNTYPRGVDECRTYPGGDKACA